MSRLLSIAAVIALLAVSATNPAEAQSAAGFYKGKTVTLLIGSGVDFAALDREEDVGGALIARNDSDLHAEHVGEERGIEVGISAGPRRSDDKLHSPQVLDRPHRRILPRDADYRVVIGAADPAELSGVEAGSLAAEQRRTMPPLGVPNIVPSFGAAL